jgi:hypothetical protein
MLSVRHADRIAGVREATLALRGIDVEKKHILREIKRTAAENAGLPLGQDRFEAETGIKYGQWRGRCWATWSDALRDAGFEPNQPNQAFGEKVLLEAMIALVRRLDRFPTWAEWNMEHRTDASFPSMSAFRRARLGTLGELASKLAEYCEDREGFEDVMRLSRAVAKPTERGSDAQAREGSVYLIKSGRHYKIGRAFAIGRRAREIALQLPERAVTIHIIRTDDPIGIEAYWHKRFETKRANGEWFALTASDVKAFQRRKSFM